MKHDSQIVKAEENLKLSNMYGGSSQGQASGTNQWIKALHQGRHWVWGLTHHCAIKEETIAINQAPTENYFSYFSTRTYIVGTQKNRLDETVLLSTQNTC